MRSACGLFPTLIEHKGLVLHFLLKLSKLLRYSPPLVNIADARSRLIVIKSNGTRRFYADPYKMT